MDELVDIVYHVCVRLQDWAQGYILWGKQRLHWIAGHNDTLIFERGRVYVECAHCHRRTAGWDVQLGGIGRAADR